MQAGAELLLGVSHLYQQACVIAGRGSQVRMLVTGVAGELKEDFERPPIQSLSLLHPIRGPRQRGLMFEDGSNARIV